MEKLVLFLKRSSDWWFNGLSLILSQIQNCNNNKTDTNITDIKMKTLNLASTVLIKPYYGKPFSLDLDSVIHRQREL